jgi:hypothetical protein
MSDHVQTNNVLKDDEISLHDLFFILWGKKLVIILISTFFAISAVFYALSLPDIYRSDVVLQVAGSNGGSIQSGSGFGGIAALTGISIPGSDMDEKANIAKQTINSRDFAKHISSFEGIIPSLMATKEYDPQSQKIIFDEEVYSSSDNTWITSVPSDYAIHKKFRSAVDVFIDIDTGFLAISVDHQSPYFTKRFLELIIEELNNLERTRDIEEAQRSQKYLSQQLNIYKVADIRNSINALIQMQFEKQMLANVKKDYLLRALDSAYVPEKKSAPVRSMIAIAGSFLGFMLAIFVVLINHFIFQKPK